MATLLVIDNYDSFTYNLVQMFKGVPGLTTKVFRSDAISLRQAEVLSPDYILISPGPKSPAHAGISIPMIRAFYTRVPILGVCLGMQSINEAFGGKTVRAPVPVHGKQSPVAHTGTGVFQGVPSPVRVARYHSLMVDMADEAPLEMTAHSEDGVIMGLAHRDHPLWGVQFHPESFMTDHGRTMVANFLNLGPLNRGNA
ncbi:anthranilate synthase component II [Desulfoluna spongiiphila]|uniref:Aminodeoxychorismate synthase, glutamine amidotransferase subunit n=1 Tax=Desulfoluna spongiiphila TaxID=419481 RepID=A0A1G5JF67_9BACT|nr:aminodeoxychorismate/anthranilate synthase component II [Desulfoluna spongiiphila]SCY86804.1 aminodeoxychorismate synthase, glutamine amidotransferase subunit [Desulfoluna spongiiphila]